MRVVPRAQLRQRRDSPLTRIAHASGARRDARPRCAHSHNTSDIRGARGSLSSAYTTPAANTMRPHSESTRPTLRSGSDSSQVIAGRDQQQRQRGQPQRRIRSAPLSQACPGGETTTSPAPAPGGGTGAAGKIADAECARTCRSVPRCRRSPRSPACPRCRRSPCRGPKVPARNRRWGPRRPKCGARFSVMSRKPPHAYSMRASVSCGNTLAMRLRSTRAESNGSRPE